MAIEREELADYVRRVIRDKDLSYREVAARSEDRISATTVSDIVNRRNQNLSARTQAGLAKGLGVPLREIQAIMEDGEPTNEAEFQDSALYFLYQQRLTADEETQKLIDLTIEMLLDRIEKTRPNQPPTTSEDKEPLLGRK